MRINSIILLIGSFSFLISCKESRIEKVIQSQQQHRQIIELKRLLTENSEKTINAPQFSNEQLSKDALEASTQINYNSSLEFVLKLIEKQNLQITATKTADLAAYGRIIPSISDLENGDLVYFHLPDNPEIINHVGVYVGEGRFTHFTQRSGLTTISFNKHQWQYWYLFGTRFNP